MKTKKRVSTRKSRPLPEGVNKRLTAYALAAGAAGGGVLALAEPARADIITVTGPGSIGVNSSKFLTINGNDVLMFSNFGVCSINPSNPSCHGFVAARAASPGAGILVHSIHNLTNPPLVKGYKIGPGGSFAGAASLVLLIRCESLVTGVCERIESSAWLNKSGYVGFKFLSKGQTHFGWAHVGVGRTGPPHSLFSASISKWAYDTVPDQTIEAGQTSAIPEPGTLSLLALGAAGLAVLRKRKRSAASRQGAPDS
jgi:hypothetical protein